MRCILLKFVLDHQHGYEETTKQCGAKEVNGFIYEEGCETSDVPYKRKECYCKRNLCNHAHYSNQNGHLLYLLCFMYSIYFMAYF